jgi:hypothetical protein
MRLVVCDEQFPYATEVVLFGANEVKMRSLRGMADQVRHDGLLTTNH